MATKEMKSVMVKHLTVNDAEWLEKVLLKLIKKAHKDYTIKNDFEAYEKLALQLVDVIDLFIGEASKPRKVKSKIKLA